MHAPVWLKEVTMSEITRMLVPTDFSPASDLAFTYAIDLARRHGSELHLLHVIDESAFATAYPDGFYMELPGVRATMMEDAKAQLDQMADTCAKAELTATTEVAVGRPAKVIAAKAMERGTDLLVMGTHGRSGVAHLVIGSVAERVVRTAPCAVLTVRDTARVADALAAKATATMQNVSDQPA